MNKEKTLVICSGGLDSVTLAYDVATNNELLALLSFDYGQLHVKEIECARNCAAKLGVPHHFIDISAIGSTFQSSLLVSNDEDIPEGHYTAANMTSTVVPNRNVIMLSIAFGLAASLKATQVAMAVHGGDHFIYPDCRPEFIEAYAKMQTLALADLADIQLFTPYLNFSKGQIAKRGAELNVPFAETWSCYKGGDIHCGRCGTCVERLEALHWAKAKDNTKYADTRFWQQAVNDFADKQTGGANVSN